MGIEKVRITKSLRGDREYKVGEVITSPIPYEILSELRMNRGSVEVLEVSSFTPAPKLVEDSPTNLTAVISDNEMDEKSLDEKLDEMFENKEPAQVKIEPEPPKQEKGSEKVVKPAAKRKASAARSQIGKRKRK